MTRIDEAIADPTSRADGRLDESPTADMQAAMREHFRSGAAGGISGDIACSTGHVVDWLNRNGYPCVGFDASAAVIAEAQARFPDWRFERSTLPSLDEIAPRTFDNLVCVDALTRLQGEAVAAAIDGLRRVLVPDGVLCLRWGVGGQDMSGRPSGAIDAASVLDALSDTTVLLSVETIGASRGARIHTIVTRMSGKRYNRKPGR